MLASEKVAALAFGIEVTLPPWLLATELATAAVFCRLLVGCSPAHTLPD